MDWDREPIDGAASDAVPTPFVGTLPALFGRSTFGFVPDVVDAVVVDAEVVDPEVVDVEVVGPVEGPAVATRLLEDDVIVVAATPLPLLLLLIGFGLSRSDEVDPADVVRPLKRFVWFFGGRKGKTSFSNRWVDADRVCFAISQI